MKTYFDIPGDGGSDVVAQVAARHQAVAAALARVEHRVAVGSGKGGVGKSTITMALGRELVARGRRVAILDADLNGPCQARLAGLEAAPWVPGEGGLALPRRGDGLGVVSFGSLLAPAQPTELGTVSHGDEHVWRSTKEFALLAQLLSTVDWGRLDLLLFDLPPGADRTLQYARFLGEGTSFVMVTIPSDLARGVVARSLTVLRQAGSDVLGYVENMAGYYCRECDAVRPLFPRPATELAAPCLGRIPFDPELAALCDRGWPEAAADSPALAAVRQITDRLLTTLETRP